MGKCCVVADERCHAPANGPGSVQTRCFGCGDYVCRACSTIRPWHHWKAKRICGRCAEEEDRVAATRPRVGSVEVHALGQLPASSELAETLNRRRRIRAMRAVLDAASVPYTIGADGCAHVDWRDF